MQDSQVLAQVRAIPSPHFQATDQGITGLFPHPLIKLNFRIQVTLDLGRKLDIGHYPGVIAVHVAALLKCLWITLIFHIEQT